MRARNVIIGLVVGVAVLYMLVPSSPARPPARAGEQAARVQSAEPVRTRPEPARGEQPAHTGLAARLVELEARLAELERERPEPQAEPSSAAASVRTEVSEADVATWMDEGLKGRVDPSATREAAAQIHDSVALVAPDLRVENVGCGERFCRASFFQDSGEPPAVRELFGAPPFTGEGFTLEEPDGRVAIYFGRNGAALNELRGEALAAAAP